MNCVTLENGRVSSAKHSFSHRNIENQAETVRTNIVRTRENSQRFTEMKQMLDQEKGNIKPVGKFCGVSGCPCPDPGWHGTAGGSAALKWHRAVFP